MKWFAPIILSVFIAGIGWADETPEISPILDAIGGDSDADFSDTGLSDWLPRGDQEFSKAELKISLQKAFPQNSGAAVRGLTDLLMKYDADWAWGNGDGLVSREELGVPDKWVGISQHLLSKAGDIRIPRPVRASSEQGLLYSQLLNKLNKQMFPRYKNVFDFSYLSRADRELELAQFFLHTHIIDRAVYQVSNPSDRARHPFVMKKFDFPPYRWEKLRRLYDHPLTGGNEDKSLNSLEYINLITDLSYADRFRREISTPENLINHPGVFKHLYSLYVRTGPYIFSEVGKGRDKPRLRFDFWNGLFVFDLQENGGNENNKLDSGELAFAFAHLQLVEMVYANYDRNHDGRLTKAEASEAYDLLEGVVATESVTEEKVIDAFFGDIGLEGDEPTWWTGIKLALSNGGGVEELYPYDFYLRLIKVIRSQVGTQW